MNRKKRNIKVFVKEFFHCVKLLDKRRKIYLYSLIPINITLILLDILTITTLAFVLTVLLNPEWAKSKPLLQKIYQLLEFNNYNYFILLLGVVSIIIFFFSTLSKYLVEGFFVKLRQILSINIVNRILKNAIESPYEWFLKQNTGQFNHLASGHANAISSFMLDMIRLLIESTALLIILIILVIQDPVLFLIFFFFIGALSFVLNKVLKNILYIIGRKSNHLSAKVGLTIREMLAGIIDIKIDQREDYFYTKHYRLHKKLHKLSFLGHLLGSAVAPILTIFLFSGILIFLVYNIIVYQSLEKVISSGAVFLAISYRSLPRIQSILGTLGAIQGKVQSISSLKKLELLRTPKKQKHSTISFQKKIQLENVVYHYPDGEALFEPLNFTIKKNETIGIIGKTGSGKSTLAKLLLGILPVKEGKILIDSHSLSKKYQKSWYSNVGYVSQKIFIFYGSLLDNIVIGRKKEEINQERIDAIANFPWIKHFIDSLPDGLKTIIGEDGSNLSGGQIQRIAIARAIYKNPEVFIFDEATNSLDNATEKLILNTINNFIKDKTIIIIAHRLSTLKNANNIYKIENRKLIHYESYEKMLQAV